VATKILGLILMIAAFSILFYLWLSALRMKNVEGEVELARNDPERPGRISDQGIAAIASPSFSLAPEQKKTADESAASLPSVTTLSEPSVSAQDAGNEDVDAACPIAATHLEVAQQIFLMGDLEGAMELAQLVIQNTSASKRQVSTAYEIKQQCC
jgi:hypothetical protein